jgi:hypothetical protein
MQSANDIERPAGAFVLVCATVVETTAKRAERIPMNFML